MALGSVLLEILRKPSIGDGMGELVMFTVALWVSVFVGVLVGWTWKPKWAILSRQSFDLSVSRLTSSASQTATSGLGSFTSLNSLKFQLPSCISGTAEEEIESAAPTSDCSSSKPEGEKSTLVGGDDLEHICRLVEEKDGGPAWIQMMDRSTPNMAYQAWRRDPETGPPQYRSRTVFEDATPELVRDFFWDDEFRLKWEDMLLHASILEECPVTGTLVVRWVRKFPFFCSDREYVIGRRIWESGRSYFCVTKGVPYSALPRQNKPRRVDLYYSSWCIRAVESKRGDGQMTACEVILFHHEDMGIPWEIAKLGVRQGMWGAVKKIDPGLRAYQKERASGSTLSRCAYMAHINTKVSSDYLRSLEGATGDSAETETVISSDKVAMGRNLPKFLVIGGAVALACSFDRGLLSKAVVCGVARRFANIGKRL